MSIEKLIGTGPNQIPTNSMLGTMAYLDSRSLDAFDGTTAQRAAPSAKYIKDNYNLPSGLYWIQTAGGPMKTYCDMDTINGGGWTLIGKSGGGSWHNPDVWLKGEYNPEKMLNTTSPGTSDMACIDARRVSGRESTEVMISSFSMTYWVKSPIHTGATEETIFNYTDGQSVIYADAVTNGNSQNVTATAWNGSTTSCYVNKYMIMALAGHGGSTPAWTVNTAGNTNINEYAMAVACSNTSHNGFTGPGNGLDAPYNSNDSGWPNDSYSTGHFYGLVWVR